MTIFTHSPDRSMEKTRSTDSLLISSNRAEGAAITLVRGTRQPRVLVVDNDHDCADGLAILIRLWDYDVRVAYSSTRAIRITATWPPDVALLDLAMPDMDGFELARLLNSRPGLEHLALIAVTGLTNAIHRDRARDLGFEGYFLKPSNLSELRSTLERVVQRSAADKWRNSC
jgi:CheY-like chemotaxis protein